ncbi:hypothetical protein DWF04_015585 [Cereibacter sphaeroides f. sp. denitrificans]|nr:hypothetical protein DWF04_16335 [Cereibacter sphaeroides f. sp. denitrificans]
MTEIDTSTEAIERLAETLLFRGHHHQEKINHLLRRLHVERITAAKTLRALAAERDRLRDLVAGMQAWRDDRCRLAADLIQFTDEDTSAKLKAAEAALTEARAETAAMLDTAAVLIESLQPAAFFPGGACYIAAAIRAIPPADASTALEAIKRQEREAGKAEGMREAAAAPGFYFGIGPNGEPDGTYCSVKPHDDPQAELYVRASRILARAAEIEKADHLASAGNPFTFSPAVAATLTEPTAEEQAELDRMTVGYLKNGAAE